MFYLTNPGPPGQMNLMGLISPQTVKAYCFVNVVVYYVDMRDPSQENSCCSQVAGGRAGRWGRSRGEVCRQENQVFENTMRFASLKDSFHTSLPSQ